MFPILIDAIGPTRVVFPSFVIVDRTPFRETRSTPGPFVDNKHLHRRTAERKRSGPVGMNIFHALLHMFPHAVP